MYATQRWSFAFHGLKVGGEPVTGHQHADDIAHAIRTAHPYNTLPDDGTRQHSAVTGPSLPHDEDDGKHTRTYQEANNSRAVPGMLVARTELQREKKHDRRRDEKREADEIELRQYFSHKGQGKRLLGGYIWETDEHQDQRCDASDRQIDVEACSISMSPIA